MWTSKLFLHLHLGNVRVGVFYRQIYMKGLACHRVCTMPFALNFIKLFVNGTICYHLYIILLEFSDCRLASEVSLAGSS